MSRVPNIFTEETIVDVAEVYQRRCLEESGQWFEENFDQTHVVLASDKLVLQNNGRKNFQEQIHKIIFKNKLSIFSRGYFMLLQHVSFQTVLF